MAAQSKLAGALSRNPKLERVSPGVYRNPKGDLVTAGGRALPRPAQPPAPQPSDYQQITFPNQQSQQFIQPPPNVPVQPWEQMGGNQAGIRPAMQTPYDRYKFAMQQQQPQQSQAQINNGPTSMQPFPRPGIINWTSQQSQNDGSVNYPLYLQPGNQEQAANIAAQPQQQNVGMQNYQRILKNM